jgi:hypothetical protein
MQSGRFRREKLVLFLSKPITMNPPASADKRFLADHYRRILHQFNEFFDQHRRVIALLFEPHGCRVTSMSTEDLFRYFAIFLNASYLKRENYVPIRQFRRRKPSTRTAGIRASRQGGTSGSSPTDTSTISLSSSAVRSARGAAFSGR